MTQQMATSSASLAARYQQHLLTSTPFSRARSGADGGDLYLLPPDPSAPLDDHHAAMRTLVSSGLLSDYRYIDSKPQAAILAIRA
jgi:hypothetical protein